MKSDYHKGITVGLTLARKHPSFKRYPHALEHEIRNATRKLEDKYSEQIGEVPCPITGEPAYMRVSWYRDGIRDGLRYGNAARFVVVRYGEPRTVDALAERVIYNDPALAWKRSWELDPTGHRFVGIDALYVNGAAREFGVEWVYGL